MFNIPSDVRRQARRGLTLAERWKRTVPTRNHQWARRLAEGESVSAAELAEMLAYLQETANHSQGLAGDGGPSAKAIARLMAGGNDGLRWAEANYGAKVGQTIKGRLTRGAGGRFSSGGAAAPAIQASDLGLSAGEMEAFAAMQAGQSLSIAQINALTAAGIAMEGANGKVRLTAAGVRMRNKLARGDVAGAKAEAEALKAKKTGKAKAGGGGKGAKEKPTPEAKEAEKRKQMEDALKKLEFTPEETKAIADFIDSGDLDYGSELGKKLVKAGLLTANKKAEEYVLTTPGRAFVRAVRQGKLADAKQALKQGRLRMKLNGNKIVKKPTPVTENGVSPLDETVEVEATVDMGEYGVWQEIPDEAYVPYGVVSFAALEANKEASQAAEQISVLTYQFCELVRNAMGNPDVADKRAAVFALVDEFSALVEATLGGVEVNAESANPPPSPSGLSLIAPDPMGEALIELAEAESGRIVELVEAEGAVQAANPLRLDIAIIKPGFGNKRDGHYYSKEVLARDAKVFEGAKMYETDHRAEEKSTRTWVSTIESIAGFTDDGAPIGKVVVHDPNFAERLRNLKAAGLLERMECSILARGKVGKGTIDGQPANVVESINEAMSVDWVTKAGAGGKALRLAESDGETTDNPEAPVVPDVTPPTDEEKKPEAEATPALPVETTPQEAAAPEQEPVNLSESDVLALLENVNPIVAKRVKGKPFATAAEVKAAVEDEMAYLKEATGSGRPITFAEAQPVTKRTRAEIEETAARVSKKYLSGR